MKAHNPNELRPVKMPRRIIAELEALRGDAWVPRWAVVERLLRLREEHVTGEGEWLSKRDQG